MYYHSFVGDFVFSYPLFDIFPELVMCQTFYKAEVNLRIIH